MAYDRMRGWEERQVVAEYLRHEQTAEELGLCLEVQWVDDKESRYKSRNRYVVHGEGIKTRQFDLIEQVGYWLSGHRATVSPFERPAPVTDGPRISQPWDKPTVLLGASAPPIPVADADDDQLDDDVDANSQDDGPDDGVTG